MTAGGIHQNHEHGTITVSNIFRSSSIPILLNILLILPASTYCYIHFNLFSFMSLYNLIFFIKVTLLKGKQVAISFEFLELSGPKTMSKVYKVSGPRICFVQRSATRAQIHTNILLIEI